MKPVTFKTARYLIKDNSNLTLDVYGKKTNALKKAIALAMEFRGTSFQVIKKIHGKEKKIFTINLDMNFDFTDIKEIYNEFFNVLNMKINTTKNWYLND